MAMVDRIKQTVESYLNTDQLGNFKPKVYDLILHDIVNDKYEELLDDVNKAVNRQNRGLINGGLENIPDKIREKIQHYLVTSSILPYVDPSFTLPTDLRYFDVPLFGLETIEMLKNMKEFIIKSRSNATEEFPIGIKHGNKITIAPSSIKTDVTVIYLRNPLQAKWTYNVIDGIEVYNPSDSGHIDVDIHSSEENDIILRVLQGMGVHLKEKDIQRITQTEKVLEFNQENQS